MLPVHPLAELFPLTEGDDFERLVADIRKHGLRIPITLYEGMILDGRNRARACEQLGIEPATVEYTGADPRAVVISQNVMRRHLTIEQRKELVMVLHCENPKASNRQIGRSLKLSDHTVAKVRAENDVLPPDHNVEKVSTPRSAQNAHPDEPIENIDDGARDLTENSEQDVFDHVRRGMALRKNGEAPSDIAAAKAIGMGPEKYIAISKALMLSDIPDLPRDDRRAVNACINSMSAGGRGATAAFKKIKPIYKRIFGHRREAMAVRKGKGIPTQEFDRVLGNVVALAFALPSLRIPHLGRERAAEVCKEIGEVQQALTAFRNTIQEQCK